MQCFLFSLDELFSCEYNCVPNNPECVQNATQNKLIIHFKPLGCRQSSILQLHMHMWQWQHRSERAMKVLSQETRYTYERL